MRGIWVTAILISAAAAAVVDRVAVVVGKNVITESEVLEEIRVTDFLNQAPLSFSPEERRTAAERLVDQQLIRNEMQIGGYQQPKPADAEAMMRSFRKENYPNEAAWQAALKKYGISEDELKRHFQWQLAVMRFTDQRFKLLTANLGEVPAAPKGAAPGTDTTNAANRAVPGTGTTSAEKPAEQGTGTANAANRAARGAETSGDENAVEQQMDAWLKQARAATRIQFKKDAFQ
jgi:hypothetical protein